MMKFNPETVARALISVCCLLSVLPAISQPYPNRPIRIIVPYGPGSSTDIVARLLANSMSQSLGQTMVVENRAGADGTIAAGLAARSVPDGYTIFLATNGPFSYAPGARKKLPYDPIKDFTPISMVGNYSFFIAVYPGLPATSLRELVAYAKTNPGKVAYATGNTTSIVATATLAASQGLDLIHVPYKSEPPALPDVTSGRVHFIIGSYSTLSPQAKDGKLRIVGTLLAARSNLLPDVPTIEEQGFARIPVEPWAAMFGPAGMPKEFVGRLSEEIGKALRDHEVLAQLEKQAFPSRSSSPEALARYTREQLDNWERAIKLAKIEPQ